MLPEGQMNLSQPGFLAELVGRRGRLLIGWLFGSVGDMDLDAVLVGKGGQIWSYGQMD